LLFVQWLIVQWLFVYRLKGVVEVLAKQIVFSKIQYYCFVVSRYAVLNLMDDAPYLAMMFS
jgi:hypothetical protein